MPPYSNGDDSHHIAQELFQTITGQSFQTQADGPIPIAEQIERKIHDNLLTLINEDLQTHQSILYQDLIELFIYPINLIEIPLESLHRRLG